jgi:hypothetical protein
MALPMLHTSLPNLTRSLSSDRIKQSITVMPHAQAFGLDHSKGDIETLFYAALTWLSWAISATFSARKVKGRHPARLCHSNGPVSAHLPSSSVGPTLPTDRLKHLKEVNIVLAIVITQSKSKLSLAHRTCQGFNSLFHSGIGWHPHPFLSPLLCHDATPLYTFAQYYLVTQFKSLAHRSSYKCSPVHRLLSRPIVPLSQLSPVL